MTALLGSFPTHVVRTLECSLEAESSCYRGLYTMLAPYAHLGV